VLSIRHNISPPLKSDTPWQMTDVTTKIRSQGGWPNLPFLKQKDTLWVEGFKTTDLPGPFVRPWQFGT